MPHDSTRRSGLLLIAVLLLSLLLVVPPLPSANAAPDSRRIVVILSEFLDVKHNRTADYFRDLFFRTVVSFYEENSYGKLRITGDLFGWITLPRAYSSFNVSQRSSPTEDRLALVSLTIRTVDPQVDFRLYDLVYLIYAGGVWGFQIEFFAPLVTDEGAMIRQVAVADENDKAHSIAHELGHLLGLPDLYDYNRRDRHDFVGPWDIMASARSLIHFTAWSKIKLGWIDNQQIQSIRRTPSYVVDLDPIEVKSNTVQVIKLIPDRSPQFFFVELRRKIGFDVNIPDEGLLVTLIDESRLTGEGPVRVQRGSMKDVFDVTPDKEPSFISDEFGFSVIVLSQSSRSYRVGVSTPQLGREANRVITIIHEANRSITRALTEGRTDGLRVAQSSLILAWSSWSEMQLFTAEKFARDSIALAQAAKLPKEYYDARDMVQVANARYREAVQKNFDSALARIMLLVAQQELQLAEAALMNFNYDEAIFRAQKAMRAIQDAYQAESEYQHEITQERPNGNQTPTIAPPNYALVVVAVIVVAAAAVGALAVRNSRRHRKRLRVASSE